MAAIKIRLLDVLPGAGPFNFTNVNLLIRPKWSELSDLFVDTENAKSISDLNGLNFQTFQWNNSKKQSQFQLQMV